MKEYNPKLSTTPNTYTKQYKYNVYGTTITKPKP